MQAASPRDAGAMLARRTSSSPFVERCQFENTIYRYAPPFDTLRRLRRAVRRVAQRFAQRAGEGPPSRFAAGAWVRVRDAAAIRATLDASGALRGLIFTDAQWSYCGKTFLVETVVRRVMNDAGRMRAIARTVALAGPTCDGLNHSGGCGRACALLFRDEWLDPSEEARGAAPAYARYARVKPLAEIEKTLDAHGRRDGVAFVPEMRRLAGARLPVLKRVEPVAATSWRRPGADFFILADARCLGESLQGEGPCHRRCGLLWHRDWLAFE